MKGQMSYSNIKNPYSDQTPSKQLSHLQEKSPIMYEQSNIKIILGEENKKEENYIPHEENSFIFIVVDEPKNINPKIS